MERTVIFKIKEMQKLQQILCKRKLVTKKMQQYCRVVKLYHRFFLKGSLSVYSSVLELNGCLFSFYCSASKSQAPTVEMYTSVFWFPLPNRRLHTRTISSFIPPLLLCGRSVPAACPDLAGRRLSKVSFLPSCSAPCARWTRCCPT